MQEIAALIEKAKSGDESAFEEIARLYTPMMQSSSASLGLDFDEVFSEACMALLSAVVSYDMGQNEVTFGLYAQICVRRRLVDFARRQSRAPILSEEGVEDIADDTGDVGDILVTNEERDRFRRDARELLSAYEYEVLIMWLGGEKTSAIAKALGTGAKSVDNAKARVLKKLREGLRPSGR